MFGWKRPRHLRLPAVPDGAGLWALGGALLLAIGAVLATYWGGPLTVAANVNDGGGGWPRTSSLVFTFSRDMDWGSVQQSFRIRPPVPVSFRAESLRRFVFTPLLQADAGYEVSMVGARRTDGPFSVNYHRAFRTAPAPTVAQITVSDSPLTEGQRRIGLQPAIRIHFTQPMDPGHVEVILDGVPAPPGSWDRERKAVSLAPTLLPGRDHTLTVPARARNARQDTMLADYTRHFRTVVENGVQRTACPERAAGAGADRQCRPRATPGRIAGCRPRL